MKIYLLTQDVNNTYDTFDSIIVAAESEDEARLIHPIKYIGWKEKERFASWAYKPEQVKVKYIGEAVPEIEKGVILASFNAG